MKTSNLFKKTFFILSLATVLFSSCNNDDDLPYVGTWSSTNDLQKSKITLTKNSFTHVMQVYNASKNTWIDLAKATGSLSADDKTMTITINSVGMSIIDPESGTSTPIILIKEGSTEFTSLLDVLDWDKTARIDYTVSDKQLIIKSDDNNDGSFDEDEITVYTKE